MNTESNNRIEQIEMVYKKPVIEIIEMEHQGSILAGSANNFEPGGGADAW